MQVEDLWAGHIGPLGEFAVLGLGSGRRSELVRHKEPPPRLRPRLYANHIWCPGGSSGARPGGGINGDCHALAVPFEPKHVCTAGAGAMQARVTSQKWWDGGGKAGQVFLEGSQAADRSLEVEGAAEARVGGCAAPGGKEHPAVRGGGGVRSALKDKAPDAIVSADAGEALVNGFEADAHVADGTAGLCGKANRGEADGVKCGEAAPIMGEKETWVGAVAPAEPRLDCGCAVIDGILKQFVKV